MHASELSQEMRVADAGKPIFLLLSVELRQIVFVFATEASEVFARLLGDRSLGEKMTPGIAAGDSEIESFASGERIRIVDQFVCTERLFVEEYFRNAPARFVEISLEDI